jgi:hypothetical protein
MARRGQRTATTERPPPLPPETRTVGQLVAETIRLYGAHFFRALPLGLVVALANQVALEFSTGGGGELQDARALSFTEYSHAAGALLVAAPLFALAYAYASALATGTPFRARRAAVAVVVGTLTFAPAALLLPWFLIAGVIWLGLVGLAVPVAVVEGARVGTALRRGFQLGRADLVHAVGSVAALVVLFALTRLVLALLLDSQAENTVRTAIFMADVVLAPLLFLGSALLYVDQNARLRSPRDRGKERHARVPDADDADREGNPDPSRESRPTA